MSRLKLRSLYPTGSLVISGSITATQFLDSNGNTLVTSAQTSSFATGLGNLSAETGSYLISGSVSGNILTFEKKDGSTFSLTVSTGSGGGSSTDITDLNNFTGSATSRLDALEAATSSYLTSANTSSLLVTASVDGNVITLEKGDGTSFTLTVDTGSGGATATSASYAATASFVPTLTNFDGNRVVSNTNLPAGIYNVNFGTSGSLANFIEKIFFPNTAPTTTTTGFTIQEFEASGSVVGTVSATDAEGQTITFATQSGYTDDFFRIHSGSGQITLNTLSTASMNTDVTPGSGSHPFLIDIFDTFLGTTSTTIYIRVNPNTAPVWRETSAVGNVITSFTQSLNENSSAGTNKVRVYFTDAESDSITIGTGSVPSEFSLTIGANYVQLNQQTGSLDFQNTPTYEFVLTASDQHYVSGDDVNTITYLPFQVKVIENSGSIVNDQTLSSINENSADGTVVGTVSATDAEGDTIFFTNFTLVRAYLNANGINITGSMGGTSLYDPHADAFQINGGNGQVTRKAGVYLNSDIADRYEYRVTVNDAYQDNPDTGLVTIPIAADAASTIGADGGTYYIIESAAQGDNLTTNSNGYTAGNVTFSSAASQRWEVRTVPAGFVRFTTGNTYYTGSSVTLEVDTTISGSGYTSGNSIAIQITASEHGFETTKQYRDHTLNITTNSAPDVIFTNTSANLNTNGARPTNTLSTISFIDAQGDALNHNSFVFTDPSGQLEAIKSSETYLVRATSNLSGSTTYQYTASIKDIHGFNTNTEYSSFTIAQAPIGTLAGDTTSYIIESAISGAVLRDATGYNAGNASQLTVSYSPQYNSAAVTSFTSSNASVAVNSSGYLTLNTNLSGSTTGSGDTISATITYQDQYGNLGSGSLTVNVFANQAPTATFTNQVANLTASISTNTYLVGVSIADTESDTPYSASLSGTDVAYFKAVPQNANSSSYQIQAATTIGEGTYNYTASIFDNFGKSRSYNQSLTVAAVPAQWYAYLAEVGVYATDEASALGSYGDGNDDGTIDANYPFYNLAAGQLGDPILSASALNGINSQYSFLVASGNTLEGSRTTAFLTNINHATGSNSNTGLFIVFPSSSNIGDLPRSMTNALGGSTQGEFVLYADRVGTGIVDAPQSAFIRYFDFVGGATYPNTGDSRFGVIFTQGDASTDIEYFLMSSSGSAPSSTQ